MKKILLLIALSFIFLPSFTKVSAHPGGLLDGKSVFVGTTLGEGVSTSVLTDRSNLTKYSVGAGEMVSYKFDIPMTITHHHFRSEYVGKDLEFYDSDKNLIKTIAITLNIKLSIVPVKNVTYIAYKNTSGAINPYWDLDIYGMPTTDTSPNLLLGKLANSYSNLGVLYTANNPKITDGDHNSQTSFSGSSSYIIYEFNKGKDIKQIYTSMLNESKYITYHFYSDLARTNLVGSYNNPTAVITDYYTTDLLYENVRSVKIVNTAGSADNVKEFTIFGVDTNIYFPVLSLSETHNHNSVDLTWTNPIGPQFTEILIKQDGVLIATLPKTELTYKATGLSLDYSYTYEVVAKYDDGGLSPVASISATTDATGPIETDMNVMVNPGLFRISHFTNIISFENYNISIQKANVKLNMPFSFSIEDFSGTWSGWNVSLKIDSILNGAEPLKDAVLTVDCLNSKQYDVDETGVKIGTGDPISVTFSCNDGTIIFGTSYPLLSATSGIDSAAKHLFEFPTEFLNLSFSNEAKSGNFSGQTTLVLITGP
jgi:hypothetical protein